ncbi:MAG: excalibur calcium-binding domain-containing protein [Chloroflexi bacterium]|nr:excalibur calcium-binding domain-containing protein [Chloroflexota bacterium]
MDSHCGAFRLTLVELQGRPGSRVVGRVAKTAVVYGLLQLLACGCSSPASSGSAQDLSPTRQPIVITASGTCTPEPYYANCDAARVAGAAPIARGQPGYRPGLERDNDSVACDENSIP